MFRRKSFGCVAAFVFASALTWLSGCNSQNSLPATVVVELPDGTTVQAVQGSGVASLIDSTWDFSQPGAGVPFATISFGPDGNLERFDDSTIAQQLFGSTLIFDGVRYPTTQDGLEYAAATFGAETSDSTGFTFEGRLSAFFSGLLVATGTATASGTFDPDDANLMTGTFSFTSEVLVPIDIPNAEVDMAFDFVVQRVD